MPVEVERRRFSDFEALQHIVQDGHTDVVQVSRGRMAGELTHIKLDPQFGVSTGWFANGVRLNGVPSQTRWLLGTVLASEGAASAQSRELKPGTMLMVPPGQERYSTYCGAARYAMTMVTDDELQTFLSARRPGAYEALRRQPCVRVLDDDPASMADRITRVSHLTKALAITGPTLPPVLVDHYKHTLLELVTTPIHSARSHDATLRRSDWMVREADNYMDAISDRPVHVPELSARLRIPERTLQRAFDEALGVSPFKFNIQKRLGKVHAALLAAHDPATMVADIAHAYGFTELGRFASTYRRAFGELPSETLLRRAKAAPTGGDDAGRASVVRTACATCAETPLSPLQGDGFRY